MLEELLLKYKGYSPLLNYFDESDYEVETGYHPMGWHCKINTEPFKDKDLEKTHVYGCKTPLEALQQAIKDIKVISSL
ncbi:MAG: hypothetical protein K0R93_712 [Anaerosolibacter sp.]|jgi:hypothetical protein|uniref:hypothetical protein n=1 Tax=Anaerosolibacter sp. TaxID=1872527 RepID=UPI002601C220|nr:hypothetical protein [Anaerosolibacter sp.]MDF2545814.1 hypothetical protein [Anaerosolibacter sp.]